MKKDRQSQEPSPKVAILILNWNGWEDTIECLESVFQINYPNYCTIVIDNGSTNESVNKIKEYSKGKIIINSKYIKYTSKNKPIEILEHTRETTEKTVEKKRKYIEGQKQIKDTTFFNSNQDKKMVLIKNEKNLGFAEGNNIGMRYAYEVLESDYILLLNNDTVVEKDFLIKMVQAGEADRQVGIVGPKIPYYDNPSKNWYCKGIVNWFSINIAYHGERCDSKTTDNDYITGCAMLVKRDVVKKVGYLNENLFLYFEDADFNLRAKNSGFSLVVEPSAIVYHKVSITSNTFYKSKSQYYFSRNRIWFVKKYCPKKYQKLSMMFLFLRLFLALGFFASKGDRATVTEIMKAYKAGIKGSY